MYISRTQKYTASQEAIGLIYSWLEAAGWELWDTISATDKVYRSNGESGERLYGYVRVYLTGSYIRKLGYRFWDNVARQGHGPAAADTDPATNTALCVSNENLFFYGSKDVVYFATSYANLNARQNPFFGHLSPWEGFYGTLAAGVAAGSNVTVVLNEDILDRFSIGHAYNISAPGAGSQAFSRCVGKDKAANAVILQSLSVSFPQGSYLGWGYRSFFVNSQTVGTGSRLDVLGDLFCEHPTPSMQTFAYNYLDLKDALFQIGGYADYANSAMSPQTGKVTGGPIAVNRWFYCINSAQTRIPHGVMGSRDFGCCAFGLPQDLLLVAGPGEEASTVRSVSSATELGLADDPAVKNWPADSLVGKHVVIVGGTGVNQTRKIVGNTAHTLTLQTPWATIPNTTSQYRIVSEVFRMVRLESVTTPSADVRPVFRESF